MKRSKEAPRPLLRSWAAVYAVVALCLAVVIFLLYLFTMQYR